MRASILVVSVFSAIASFAQPTDLIFSEYIEGLSNDKCIEIYNGTGAPVSLNGYSVRIYSNGSAAVSSTIALPNVTLANCDVYVICNSAAQAPLLAIDDMSSGSLNFNGDDAVELFNGTAMVDLIGNIGCDPGTEWTGVGNGTADDVIRRQTGYCTAVGSDPGANCPWPSFTAANWSSALSTSDFSDLGVHTSTCGVCVSNTITTGVIAGSPFTVTCVATAAVDVPFTSTGTFNAGNIYTAQLSNAAGSFAFPVNIGTLSSTANSGTINATIPAGTASGTGYRIRVVSNNPIVTGTDNGVNLTINGIVQGTMIVNEISNGASGSQEYMEFLVTGTPCSVVSIQNFIFDDNNGDFGAGTGVASGHYRFTTASQWGCIPTGSLVVVYNPADRNPALPADDETDVNADSVYILPVSSTYLEQCTTVPNSSPVTTYTGCTYVAGSTWNPLGLANSGDAAQLRLPDGTYEHGIGFGAATGGPDGILLAGGAGNNFYFSNAVDNDATNVANFSSGTAPANETPGAGNTAANITYIESFRCVVLPVELLSFEVIKNEYNHLVLWSTASENGTKTFEVERAGADFIFHSIGMVQASGYSHSLMEYQLYDNQPLLGVSYYRLKQRDLDGRVFYSDIKAVYRTSAQAEYFFDGKQIKVPGCMEGTSVEIYSSDGKLVMLAAVSSQVVELPFLPSGIFMVRLLCGEQPLSFKIGIVR
ncbi:MAG: lamin tail domain-containing protein [Bacteroidota bacterium]